MLTFSMLMQGLIFSRKELADVGPPKEKKRKRIILSPYLEVVTIETVVAETAAIEANAVETGVVEVVDQLREKWSKKKHVAYLSKGIEVITTDAFPIKGSPLEVVGESAMAFPDTL